MFVCVCIKVWLFIKLFVQQIVKEISFSFCIFISRSLHIWKPLSSSNRSFSSLLFGALALDQNPPRTLLINSSDEQQIDTCTRVYLHNLHALLTDTQFEYTYSSHVWRTLKCKQTTEHTSRSSNGFLRLYFNFLIFN